MDLQDILSDPFIIGGSLGLIIFLAGTIKMIPQLKKSRINEGLVHDRVFYFPPNKCCLRRDIENYDQIDIKADNRIDFYLRVPEKTEAIFNYNCSKTYFRGLAFVPRE